MNLSLIFFPFFIQITNNQFIIYKQKMPKEFMKSRGLAQKPYVSKIVHKNDKHNNKVQETLQGNIMDQTSKAAFDKPKHVRLPSTSLQNSSSSKSTQDLSFLQSVIDHKPAPPMAVPPGQLTCHEDIVVKIPAQSSEKQTRSDEIKTPGVSVPFHLFPLTQRH